MFPHRTGVTGKPTIGEHKRATVQSHHPGRRESHHAKWKALLPATRRRDGDRVKRRSRPRGTMGQDHASRLRRPTHINVARTRTLRSTGPGKASHNNRTSADVRRIPGTPIARMLSAAGCTTGTAVISPAGTTATTIGRPRQYRHVECCRMPVTAHARSTGRRRASAPIMSRRLSRLFTSALEVAFRPPTRTNTSH